MTYAAWTALYKRLCALYGKTPNGTQGAAYYEAVSQFPETVMEQAITAVSREHKTWPSVAVLCEAARGILRGLTLPASACQTCHGDMWVEGPPRHEFGRVYETVVRCPECWTLGSSAKRIGEDA